VNQYKIVPVVERKVHVKRRAHLSSLVWVKGSGGASAVKEPGHFEVRKSSRRGHLDALFSSERR